MCVTTVLIVLQVFLVRRIMGKDAGKLYAMKVLKKASLKGRLLYSPVRHCLGFCLLSSFSIVL